jgi:hypothetical protein
MCFSAEVSFTAAAILLPAGVAAVLRAYKTDRRYIPIASLPVLFGLQQALEGAVWTSAGNQDLVAQFSLAYMFFSWLAWPVWTPFSVYFLEPARRKPLFAVFAIFGGILGGTQYFPYFAHDNWLITNFLERAISYEGEELFDYIIGCPATYMLYVSFVIGPLLLSSHSNIRIFGLLVFSVLIVTYIFFAYAYISVFCFGGGIMSLYLVWMIFGGGGRQSPGTARPL